LIIVLITKFANGAWIVVVAMPIIWLTLRGVHRHYSNVAAELTPDPDMSFTLPSRNHAIVLVSKLHLPALRALAYAKATGPSTLEALTVAVDDDEVAALKREWDERRIPVPLTVIGSPYREMTRPIVDYVTRLRRESPRDIVTIYVPEYVVGHWWERLLHNQSALRLKSRLLYQRGVVVASVPWQLVSSKAATNTTALPGHTGDLRFGGGRKVQHDGSEEADGSRSGTSGDGTNGQKSDVPASTGTSPGPQG
jgi:hypothetical protein